MKVIIKVNLGLIKKLRKEKKISQKTMAEALGYESATGYAYLESGRCSITAEQIYIISQMVDRPILDLYHVS